MSLSSNKLYARIALACTIGTVFLCTLPMAMAQGSSPMFNYMQYCVGCHLPDGSGFPPEVPNLRRDFAYLIDNPEGRDFMMRVPGVTGAQINSQDMADLLNWMISNFYPDNTGFEPITAGEVEAGRERPLHDPIKYRNELFPELKHE